jgi:hypothetical protein
VLCRIQVRVFSVARHKRSKRNILDNRSGVDVERDSKETISKREAVQGIVSSKAVWIARFLPQREQSCGCQVTARLDWARGRAGMVY